METSKLSSEEMQSRLESLEDKVRELRKEERQIKEEIARLQAELSRGRGRDRRRARIDRSASIPSLQIQRRRVGAEIFQTEQEIRSLREQLAAPG
jgi:peptidoglycan hydrolase CwlO-like protein